MKKTLFLIFSFYIGILNVGFAREIILECSWDVNAVDYPNSGRNSEWITFDHNQKFKLKIKDNEMVIYDYLLEYDWEPSFIIAKENEKYLVGVEIDNTPDGPVAAILTHIFEDGFTTMMSTDYYFGLTVQSGYCK